MYIAKYCDENEPMTCNAYLLQTHVQSSLLKSVVTEIIFQSILMLPTGFGKDCVRKSYTFLLCDHSIL